ncbi:hypothetical protein ACOME3_010334 [Neoechinorhynchus agilis]
MSAFGSLVVAEIEPNPYEVRVMAIPIIVIGVLGNGFSIYMFRLAHLRTRGTYRLLLHLSMLDIAVVILTMSDFVDEISVRDRGKLCCAVVTALIYIRK